MSKSIFILVALIVLYAVSASAFTVDSNAVWLTQSRDSFYTGTQPASYSTNWVLSGATVANTTVDTLTLSGYLPFTINQSTNLFLVEDLNNDGRPDIVAATNDTLYVLGLNKTKPYIVSSFSFGGQIVGHLNIVRYPVGNTNTETDPDIPVLTNTGGVYQVSFMTFSNGVLSRKYVTNPNDEIWNLAGLITSPSDIICKTGTGTITATPSLCAITGLNDSSGRGEVLLFTPNNRYSNGVGYYPMYYQLNLTSGMDTFPNVNKFCPWGQNCVALDTYFYTKAIDKVVIIPTVNQGFTYPFTDRLFFTDGYGTKLWGVDINANALLFGSGTVAQYDVTYNQSSGVSVPKATLGSSYTTNNEGSTGWAYVKLIPFDVQSEGQQQPCIIRQRSGNVGDAQMYVESVCFNSTAGQFETYASVTGYGGTNFNYLTFSQIAQQSNFSGSYNAYCGITFMDSVVSKTYFQCFYYNGTGMQSVTSGNIQNDLAYGRPQNDVVATWNEFMPVSRFQPYGVNLLDMYQYANVTLSASPSGVVINSSFASSTLKNSLCLVADLGYGRDMETICGKQNTLIVIQNTNATSSYANTSQNWTIPSYTNESLKEIFGYGIPNSCTNSVQTFIARRCTGSNAPCSFTADPTTAMRLVTDCGTGAFATGAFSLTDPTVSCTMPSTAQIITPIFYLQSTTGTTDYTVSNTVTVNVQPTNCNLANVTDPDGNPTNKTIPSPTPAPNVNTNPGNPGDEANTFISQLLGTGSNPMKTIIGFILIIAMVIYVARLETVSKMQSPAMILIITAIIATMLVTFIGFLPMYIMIVVVLILALGILALRVLFPNTGA